MYRSVLLSRISRITFRKNIAQNFTYHINKYQINLSKNRLLCTTSRLANKVPVTFILHDGTRLRAEGKIGDSLLDVVNDNSLDLDGYGSCEGELACSSCHLVFAQTDFDSLPNRPSEEELDLLELAPDFGDTSRLGCQVRLDESMRERGGIEVHVPATVLDARLND